VRIARKAPRASASAITPEGMWASVVELAGSPSAITSQHR
jgi:hypothetical protein